MAGKRDGRDGCFDMTRKKKNQFFWLYMCWSGVGVMSDNPSLPSLPSFLIL